MIATAQPSALYDLGEKIQDLAIGIQCRGHRCDSLLVAILDALDDINLKAHADSSAKDGHTRATNLVYTLKEHFEPFMTDGEAVEKLAVGIKSGSVE